MADYQEYRRRILHRRWRRMFITAALLILLVLLAAVGVLWKRLHREPAPNTAQGPTILQQELTGSEWNTISYTPARRLSVQTLDNGMTAMDFRLAAQPASPAVERSSFSDVSFLGDSLTQGMQLYDTGHVNVHETGAIEATGHKVIAMPGTDGKLTPAAIAAAAAQHCAQPGVYDEHMVLPRMAYISDATELGTVYTKAELTALRAACDAHGMYLYLDGARLAQALTAAGSDLQPEDLPRLCDAFYIGGTKNGLLFGEAMVIVNDALKPGFRRAMKRNGAMLAKGRLLGVQFAAAMEHDLWLELGRYADAQAQRIAAALSDRGIAMYVPSPTNQIFPILSDAQIARLQEQVAFNTTARVDAAHQAVRFVTSWATTDAQVDALLAVLAQVLD